MLNKWMIALKSWNDSQPGMFCIPKKGTPQHRDVVSIMKGGVASKASVGDQKRMDDFDKFEAKVRARTRMEKLRKFRDKLRKDG